MLILEPVAKADDANEEPTADTLVIEHQRSTTVPLEQDFLLDHVDMTMIIQDNIKGSPLSLWNNNDAGP